MRAKGEEMRQKAEAQEAERAALREENQRLQAFSKTDSEQLQLAKQAHQDATARHESVNA